MVRLSHPACAITSAEKELGTCTHPFTAVPPSCQIFLRRFSLPFDPSRRASVAPETCRTDPSWIQAEVPVSVVGEFGHFSDIPATFHRIPAYQADGSASQERVREHAADSLVWPARMPTASGRGRRQEG